MPVYTGFGCEYSRESTIYLHRKWTMCKTNSFLLCHLPITWYLFAPYVYVLLTLFYIYSWLEYYWLCFIFTVGWNGKDQSTSVVYVIPRQEDIYSSAQITGRFKYKCLDWINKVFLWSVYCAYKSWIIVQ